jgi:hypothetical protein
VTFGKCKNVGSKKSNLRQKIATLFYEENPSQMAFWWKKN